MPKKMTKITTSELILSAIFYLQQKNGVTAKEITKYICEKRGCAQKHMKENVKKALERATVKGIFCRNRGLYRINNGFGLNKILNNKTKGRGKKTNKGAKPKGNVPDEKTDFQVRFEEGKESEPMPLNEIVDERMNDVYDNRGFYVELPGSYEQDDDDDEDFEDTEDDDENDFFSDDMDENAHKTEPKTLFFNENVNDNSLQGMDDLNGSSDCNSFTDPFRRASKEENAENEERLEEGEDDEKKGQEEDTRDSEHDIPESGSEQIRENSKESSENPSETVQYNDENQSGDEDRDNEGYGDQHQEEMDWDFQLNDLECLDRLLEDDYPMDMAQREHGGSDTEWENSKEMKIQKNSSRIKLSIEDDPTDSFEASHINESTR